MPENYYYLRRACRTGDLTWLQSRKDLAADAQNWKDSNFGADAPNAVVWAQLLDAASERNQNHVITWLVNNLQFPVDFNLVALRFAPESFVREAIRIPIMLQSIYGLENWRDGLAAVESSAVRSLKKI